MRQSKITVHKNYEKMIFYYFIRFYVVYMFTVMEWFKYIQAMQKTRSEMDFSQLLSKLVARATAYTVFHLTLIEQCNLHFTIHWLPSHKTKNYRIRCPPALAIQHLMLLKQAINHFPIKKVTFQKYTTNQSIDTEYQKQLLGLLSETQFSQVLVTSLWAPLHQLLPHILSIQAKKIIFKCPLSPVQIHDLLNLTHKQNSKQEMHIQIHNYKADSDQLFALIKLWQQSLPQKVPYISQQPQNFGFPQARKSIYLPPYRQQQFSLYFDQQQILTLKLLPQAKCSILLKESAQKILPQVIRLMSQITRQVSLQVSALNGYQLVQFSRLCVRTLQGRQYRVSVGHQIQLTALRVVLNTTDLSIDQVWAILQLIRQPGHYQLICYSSQEYLWAAIQIFRIKPFIKFNFFMPLQEFQGQRRQLVEKMSRHAQWLRVRVYSYAALLKQLSGLGYLAVNTIFYSMGQKV